MKAKKKSWLLICLLFAMGASRAHAAQVAIVEVEGTAFLDGPQKKANVLFKLKKGTRLDISNYPTEGYYKARTMDHKIGWVLADSLDLQKSKTSDAPVADEPEADSSN